MTKYRSERTEPLTDYERGYLRGYREALDAAGKECVRLATALDHAGKPYRRPADAAHCAVAVRNLPLPFCTVGVKI